MTDGTTTTIEEVERTNELEVKKCDEQESHTANVITRNEATASPTESDEYGENEDDEDEEVKFADDGMPLKFTKSGRMRATPFPMKLMQVLSSKEYIDIVSWMPSGRCFMIHNSKVFTREVLPKHFKSAKYSSFTRKLHRWGFTRHYKGDEEGAFYAKNFQKDRMDLVEQMTCYRSDTPGMLAAKEKKRAARAEKALSPDKKFQTQQAAALAHMQQQNPHQFANMQMMMQQQQQQPLNAAARPDLNAAIEMEVSRRLQERMAAAGTGLSQQQQQQQQQQMPNHAPSAVMTGVPSPPQAMMPPPGYVLAATNPNHHQPMQLQSPTFMPDPRFMWQQAAPPQFVPVSYVQQRPANFPYMTTTTTGATMAGPPSQGFVMNGNMMDMNAANNFAAMQQQQQQQQLLQQQQGAK